MKDEISRILSMMENGTIDSEKAAELIDLLKTKESKQESRSANYLDKTLKIRIDSKNEENVNVNLPLRLVHVILKAGHNIATNIPQAAKYIQDVDITLIIDAIDNELDGKIVDITSKEGNVQIFIE